MAFTVQSDDGDVVDANAYITVEYFTTYHTDRGVANVVNAVFTDTQVQGAIIRATDYADNRWPYNGYKVVEGQSTEFPREDLYDREGTLVEGIPEKVKRAIAEYALRSLDENGDAVALAPDPEVDESGLRVQAKTEKVGPLEESVTYAQGVGIATMKPYPAADRLLREYIRSSQRVIR